MSLESPPSCGKLTHDTARRLSPDGMLSLRTIPVAFAYQIRHAWMSYMVDKPPPADPITATRVREWEPKEHRPTLTWSRSGYKPYNTYVIFCSMYEAACADPIDWQSEEQVLPLDASCEAPPVSDIISHMETIVHIKNSSVQPMRGLNMICWCTRGVGRNLRTWN